MSKPDINLWEVLYRKRLGLGPFYVGIGAAALAGLSALVGDIETIIGVTVIGLALGAWAHTRLADKLRRLYTFTVIIVSCAWVILAHLLAGDAISQLIVANLSGTLLLGIGWWTSHRNRAQVKMAETLEDWPSLSKRINYDKIGTPRVTLTPIGYGGKFSWPPGVYDVDEVIRDKRKFENVLGAHSGTIRMEPVVTADGKTSTNSVKWQIITNDPHAAPQEWQPPETARVATDPLAIGPREDGRIVTIRRYERDSGVRHAMAAGATESGKSSLVNEFVAEDVLDDEVFTIGIDLKQVELTPWRRAMGCVITRQQEAAALIRGMDAPGGLLEERGNILAERGVREGRGVRIWDTKKDGPIISITLDEAKDLLGKGDSKTVDAFAAIANKGRALGVRFILATQYPTLEAIGSSQIREQIRHRFCFRMQSSAGEDFVMPGHRVRAEKIDSSRKGTCYMLDGEKLEGMPIRVFYLDDDMVAAVVRARAGHTPELDARSAAAITRYYPAFADRDKVVPGVPDESPGTTAGTDAGSPGTATGTGAGTPGTSGTDTTGTVPADDESENPMSAEELAAVEPGTGPDLELDALLASRRGRMSDDERDKLERDRRAALEAVPEQRLSEDEARDALLRALAEAGPDGARARDLQAAANRKSTWFYNIANQMSDSGIVKRTEHGMWALVVPRPELVKNSSDG